MSLETIVIPDPGPGEVVVAIQACGVCHTDLHYREGGINDEFPFLLGHEAAGTVETVGEGVTEVAPGDYVILNWRAVCGECRACRRGQAQYCFNTHNATQKMTLLDGTELSPALGIGAFCDKTLVAAGQCTKVDPAAPATAAGLLGCGVMAGIGAAINTGGVTRGQSVAVSSAAEAWATRRSPERNSLVRRRSSPSTSTTASSNGRPASAPHTRSTRRRPIRSRRSRTPPGASAPMCASRPSVIPPCTARRSRPGTWPARSCSSECHAPT